MPRKEPKRGPGVAELEKMLREQEEDGNKEDDLMIIDSSSLRNNIVNNKELSLLSNATTSYISPPLPSRQIPNQNVLLNQHPQLVRSVDSLLMPLCQIPNQNVLLNRHSQLVRNVDSLLIPSCGSTTYGSAGADGGPLVHENILFSTTDWSGTTRLGQVETQKKLEVTNNSMSNCNYQILHDLEHLPSMINYSPRSFASSNTRRMLHQNVLKPPSSKIYSIKNCNVIPTLLPEGDEKMVGLRSFFDPKNSNTPSREAKKDGISTKWKNTNYGARDHGTQEEAGISVLNLLPNSQEGMKEGHQKSEPNGLDYNKPFYQFFQSDHEEMGNHIKNQRSHDQRGHHGTDQGDDIDLELKL